MRESPQQRGVLRFIISVKCVRLGARAAVPDEIRHHAVLTRRRAPPATLTHGRNTTRAFFSPEPLNPAAFRPAFIPPHARPTTHHSPPLSRSAAPCPSLRPAFARRCSGRQRRRHRARRRTGR